MSKLSPTLPLDGFEKTWPDFSLKESHIGELVSLACILNEEQKFASAFTKAFEAGLPEPNQMIDIKGGIAMWSGQDQYMLLLSGENPNADTDVAASLQNTAYTTLQSDAWACLDIKGDRIFDVLERFMPLNIRRAPANFAARTSAHHIAVIILKFSETNIRMLTPRSSAQSFLEGLTHTADNVLVS